MRVLPPALAQKLDNGVTTLALAWRLTRKDGVAVAVTQHDCDVTFDGTSFIAAASFVGGDHDREVNLGPDRTALSGALSSGAITETDLALGRWDHATVEAFWVDWSHPSDFIPMWSGIVAGATWRGSAFELDIVGPESVLSHEIGRVYTRTCDAALGDGRCKVDLAAPGAILGAVITQVASDRRITVAVPIGRTMSDFVGGHIKIVSGPATGWLSYVAGIEASATTWHLSLSRPFPVAPLPGDSVQISMGCDKTFETCKARFANALNFRGQPTLPGDDVAFGGPANIGNSGSKR